MLLLTWGLSSHRHDSPRLLPHRQDS